MSQQPQDPRGKNKIFEAKNISEYLEQYSQATIEAVRTVDRQALDKALKTLLDAIKRGAHVYVAGNGGSAAIADHLCCDFTKGTFFGGRAPLRTHSLVANNAVLTALGNDYGYEHTIASHLEMVAGKGDVLILISSSGNSPNILKAAAKAREMGITTIGLSGFSGGGMATGVDVHLHVAVNNYGVAEDSHQMIMHVLAQFIAKHRDQTGA